MGPSSVPELQDQWPSQGISARSPEAVRLALAAFDASLNSIISMTAIRDANGQIVDFQMQTANKSVEQSLAMTPDQIIGTRLLDTFPGNLDSGLFDVYVRVVTTGKPDQTTQYYKDDKGLEAWFTVSAVLQEPETVVVTFMNVTDSKQAELALKQQTDLFQAVLDNVQAAISLHAAIRNANNQIVDFRTLMANRRAKQMWGDLEEPIMTQTFLQVATPDQLEQDFDKYIRVVETGEPDLTEFNIGEQWWLRRAAKSGDGVVILNMNISENRHYRQQLEAANTELKRSNENLQSFAYIASHDLQEPLRKIQAFGDILKEQYSPLLDNEGQYMIERMQLAAERMSSLIRDLLDYSQITSQRDMFRPFSLTKLLEDIIEDLWHPIEHTNARIELGSGKDYPLPDLVGDRFQLRQLFQNLLSNALKFYKTNEEGLPIPPVITVSAQQKQRADLPVDVQQDLPRNESFWVIRVADNGIGFDQKHADLVFEVFKRLHSRQKFEGTGVGLAVVKKVVEQHDGAIRVQSKLGKGTIFTIYLPAYMD
ncbi:sensor histidine kinase [Spirosoma fluviale]|uniref:histidine kinase n=1 Tax=Spirosoma fluviale TaxID=1597977 RepID=A0A286FA25_9BACT|nr:ATP-binding protein [Spirosoma fluviale]SOD79694.1 His Kinase A (phospho-acceptor) domain-containing protein [Spirosoma fluviale]